MFSRGESPGNASSLWAALQQFLCCHLLTQLVPVPRASVVLSNSGTMWHLGVACPELLLCVWEAVPQTRIEGSLQLQQLLPSEKSSSNLHSMKQQGLAKAALNQIKTILSYLFHDAVLVFPQRARANENFSAEKNQLVLAGRGKC